MANSPQLAVYARVKSARHTRPNAPARVPRRSPRWRVVVRATHPTWLRVCPVRSRQTAVEVPALAGFYRGSRLKPTRNDARYQGKISVWYPFHPLYGTHDLSVVRVLGAGGVEYAELAAQQRQVVPSWMLDQDRCADDPGAPARLRPGGPAHVGRLAASSGVVNLTPRAFSGREGFPFSDSGDAHEQGSPGTAATLPSRANLGPAPRSRP